MIAAYCWVISTATETTLLAINPTLAIAFLETSESTSVTY